MTLGAARVLQADARHLPLSDDSVDLIITSPPYFAVRSYQDAGQHYAGQIGSESSPSSFVDSLIEATRECMRVLKPSGSLWVNLGDKYAQSAAQWGGSRRGHQGILAGSTADEATRFGVPLAAGAPSMGAARPKSLIGIPWRYAIRCVDDLGLILRAEVVWSKPNGLPESVRDRARRSHETWFHLTLQPHYFSTDQAAVPQSVWAVATEPLQVPDHLGVDHHAAFPTEWPKRIIEGWSEPGMTVLDPFGGTGTTALVAKALGRVGVSVDMSADYCRLAEWRTNDRDQLAKVLELPKVDQPHPDETPLFDLGQDDVA